jgi:hypothetical protein
MTPERGWAPGVAAALEGAGFEVQRVEEHGAFARVHLVAHTGESWIGVADPDWEGSAATMTCTMDGT